MELFQSKEQLEQFEQAVQLTVRSVCQSGVMFEEDCCLRGLLGVSVDNERKHGTSIDYEWRRRDVEDGEGKERGMCRELICKN